MTPSDVRQSTPIASVVPLQGRVTAFMSAVYGWMSAGLAITATSAWFIARSPMIV